jgi:hypothetical protein
MGSKMVNKLPINYHDSLGSQEHSVIFAPQPEAKGVSLSQAHVAKLGQVAAWKSAVTAIAWHLKSSQKGLQPVRPVVIWTQDVTLQPGKILVLQN